MKKMNKNASFVFYVCVLVAVMALVSANMISGLYARYTSGTDDSSGARVARFDVASKEKDGVALSIDLDFFDPEKQTDFFEFEVTSSSEVAVKYDVVLMLPGEMTELVLDGALIVKMDGSSSGVIDAASKTVTFEGDTFSPGTAQTYVHKITFEINPGTMLLDTVNITEPATLRIHAEQID